MNSFLPLNAVGFALFFLTSSLFAGEGQSGAKTITCKSDKAVVSITTQDYLPTSFQVSGEHFWINQNMAVKGKSTSFNLKHDSSRPCTVDLSDPRMLSCAFEMSQVQFEGGERSSSSLQFNRATLHLAKQEKEEDGQDKALFQFFVVLQSSISYASLATSSEKSYFAFAESECQLK